MIPHDLPPGLVVYQQTQRWIKAGVFEAMVHDLRTEVQRTTCRRLSKRQVVFLCMPQLHSPSSWCSIVVKSPKPIFGTNIGDKHHWTSSPSSTYNEYHNALSAPQVTSVSVV